MGKVIVTARLMPDNPNADLDEIGKAAREVVNKTGEFGRIETKPIAFGLKAVIIYFIVPEKEGGTEEVEKSLSEIPHVQSVEITDVRRAI